MPRTLLKPHIKPSGVLVMFARGEEQSALAIARANTMAHFGSEAWRACTVLMLPPKVCQSDPIAQRGYVATRLTPNSTAVRPE